MKKKRRIKWKNVLIVIITPMIIIGGVLMYFNGYLKSDDIKENTLKDTTSVNDDNVIDETTSVLKSAPLDNDEFNTLSDGEYLTSTGHTLEIIDGLAYVDGNLIVNKTYSLSENYLPTNLYQNITSDRCVNCLDKEVMQSFKLMQSDARSVGLDLYLSSGYRSYKYQDGLYNRYVLVDGIDGADTYSARPGHSEHQTGLCFDLNEVADSFATTDEGRWVNDNAHLYGFVIRYPKGKEDITGYKYEAWHLRYVGKELAEKLYNNGNWITIEEYYGLSSKY